MRRQRTGPITRLGLVVARTLLVGALAGVVGGGFLFFVFGFIGFAGAPLPTRVANGWSALLDPGLGKGLVVGAAISVALIVLIGLWTGVARRFDPVTARPWLALVSGAIVVLFNREALRNTAGWDIAGIATTAGISILVAVIVWLVAPWVLRDWPWSGRMANRRQGPGRFAVRGDG